MLNIIPCVYILSFLYTAYKLYNHQPQFILRFFLFGLPIYFTSLSLLNQLGLGMFMPVFQGFKELIVISTLGYFIYHNAQITRLTVIDKLVFTYFVYTALYLFYPLAIMDLPKNYWH